MPSISENSCISQYVKIHMAIIQKDDNQKKFINIPVEYVINLFSNKSSKSKKFAIYPM